MQVMHFRLDLTLQAGDGKPATFSATGATSQEFFNALGSLLQRQDSDADASCCPCDVPPDEAHH